MRPSTQRIQSSAYTQEFSTSSKRESNRISQGFAFQTDKLVERSKSRRSQLVDQKRSPTLTYINTPTSQNTQFAYQRHTFSAGQYFQQPSIGGGGSQHQFSIDRVNNYQQNSLSSKNSIANSNISEIQQVQFKKMKTIIIQKDKCIREMTERLKGIMQQLDRCQIQSKANQCFTRLMTDLSRMFQIPDISIQDIRIQVSTLLQQRKSRQHNNHVSQRKNVQQIQQLIDRLNNEATMKNTLEIKLVDLNNQNINLKSTIESLNITISKMNMQIKDLYSETGMLKRQLEENTKIRKSGAQIMGGENKLLRIQNEQIVKQKQELQQQLRQLQRKILDNQGAIVQYESKYSSQIRKRDFQQEQYKRQLELYNSSKQNMLKQIETITRQYKQSQNAKRQLQRVNSSLKFQTQKYIQQSKMYSQQIQHLTISQQNIKVQLMGQQSRTQQEYQHYITSYKQAQIQLQNRLKQSLENQRIKHQQSIEYKLQKQRLQQQLNQKNRELDELKANKTTIQLLQLQIDGKLQLTLKQMQSLRQSKDNQLENKARQIRQSMFDLEDLQRQLNSKTNQIEAVKRSFDSQSQSLDQVKRNLMSQYSKQNQAKMQLQEQLKLKTNQIIDYQNRILTLQNEVNDATIQYQKIQSLMKGQLQGRRQAERIQQQLQTRLQRQKSLYQQQLALKSNNVLDLTKQIGQMQLSIGQFEFKISNNDNTIKYLKQEIEQRQKINKQMLLSNDEQKSRYEKLSLELSTSQKQIFASKQTQHQRKFEEMNSLIIDLQNNLKSKETIIQKLNSQLESINSNMIAFDFGKNIQSQSQKSLNLSQQQIEFKQSLGQIEGFSKDLEILRTEKKQLQQRLLEIETNTSERQLFYQQQIQKYQIQINQLKQQLQQALKISSQNQQNLSHASITTSNNHMSVIQSQPFQQQQIFKTNNMQQIRYQKLEADTNQHIADLKQLHSNAIQSLQNQYNQSKQQFSVQLRQISTEIQTLTNEKISLQQKTKQLLLQLQQKDNTINNYIQHSFGANQDSTDEINLLKKQLQIEIKNKLDLQLQIKAYEQAISQLQKKCIQQQQQFQILKDKNLQTSFSKVNEMTELFQRQKQSLNITIQNKTLQVKTLQDEISQLRLQIRNIKQQSIKPRPSSIQYNKQLEQKAHTMRQLQMQNSFLSINIQDMKKQSSRTNNRLFEMLRQHKQQKFNLEKENIQLTSKVKVLEIKIQQLNFQLKGIKQIKSNTLLSNKILGSLNYMENKVRNNSSSFGVVNNSRNNSFNNTTTIDLLKQKTYTTPIISQQKQINFIKETLPISNVMVPKINKNQFTINDNFGVKRNINNQFITSNTATVVHTNQSPGKIISTPKYSVQPISGINSYSAFKTSSQNIYSNLIEKKQLNSSKGKMSPHRIVEVKQQVNINPYFSKRAEKIGQSKPITYYSPPHFNNFSQTRNLIQSKSMQKVFDYSKVYDQNIKIRENSINNEILLKEPSIVAQAKIIQQSSQIKPNSLIVGNSMSNSKNNMKINLKQFGQSIQQSEHFTQHKVQNSNTSSVVEKPLTATFNIEKGMAVYQKDNYGSDSCC